MGYPNDVQAACARRDAGVRRLPADNDLLRDRGEEINRLPMQDRVEPKQGSLQHRVLQALRRDGEVDVREASRALSVPDKSIRGAIDGLRKKAHHLVRVRPFRFALRPRPRASATP